MNLELLEDTKLENCAPRNKRAQMTAVLTYFAEEA